MQYDYVAVVGESAAGKSTFARALGAALGWNVAETGHVLDKPLAGLLEALKPAIGIPMSARQWFDDMTERKADYRLAKRTLGDQLCALDPGCLVRACMAEGRIVVGMRRPEEVTAMLGQLKMGERLLLVIVCRQQPMQPLTAFLALQVETVEINNNRGVDELQRDAVEIARRNGR